MFQQLISSLSSNSKKVLVTLLNQESPVSAHFLATFLDLSISQVRYSIRKIQACLEINGIELIQKPNEGIFIAAKQEKKSELLSVIRYSNKNRITLNQEERVKLLLQIILTARQELTQVEIRERTDISYTSFYRDIEKVKKWLKYFSIRLISRRNASFKLEGDETKIRDAIQQILLQNLGQNFLIQACVLPIENIEIKDIEKNIFTYQIEEFIKSMDLPGCEKQIRNLEEKYQCSLFDRVHIELTLYLGVMRNRLRAGNILKDASDAIFDFNDGYKRDAENIVLHLKPNYELRSFQKESEYLAYLLTRCFQHGVSYRQKEESTHKAEIKKRNKLAAAIVKEIAKYLHASLYEDEELIRCIAWELAYFSNQGDPDAVFSETIFDIQTIGNSTEQILHKIITPLLSEAGYKNITDIVRRISNHVCTALERVNTSSSQRKVLLVCGSGVATAFSLKSQINSQLPEIEVVGITSIFELAHNAGLLKDCDAVISTVPLGNITSVLQIHVNSLLTEEDIELIKDTLELKKDYQFISSTIDSKNPFSFKFKEILDKRTICTQINVKQPDEVIEEVGKLLLNADAIWPSYIKAMKNLYFLYGPYMVIAPNTVLLHAGPEMGSKKLAISLVTLNTPINFGHKSFDPVKIAMAFSSPVNSNRTNTLTDVFNFFADEQNRLRIIKAKKPEDILFILQNS